jgi:hypothetical protein
MKGEVEIQRIWVIIISIAFFTGIGMISATVSQNEFYSLLFWYSLSFLSFIGIYYYAENIPALALITIAISARMLTFLSPPQLSDDYNRFYWDAKVSELGISPYSLTPEEYSSLDSTSLTIELKESLNSPNYYSVYPPGLQYIYSTALYFSDGSISSFANQVRMLYLIVEILIILLFIRATKSKNWVIYALNPLVIIELTGNLHAEVFVVLGLVLILTQKTWSQILGWAVAIGSKISPIIWLPLWGLQIRRNLPWINVFAITGLLGLLFWPLMKHPDLLLNFYQSLRLYFQTFEFNGSIYVLSRELAMLYFGYNPIAIIGPSLQIVLILIILSISWSYRKIQYKLLANPMYYIFLMYLLFATTVHPWYIVPLVALVSLQWKWSGIIWSYTIIFSYIYYSEATEWEKTIFHSIQYLALMTGLFIDIGQKKARKKLPGFKF